MIIGFVAISANFPTEEAIAFPRTSTTIPNSTETTPLAEIIAFPDTETVTEEPELGTVGSERTMVYMFTWLL